MEINIHEAISCFLSGNAKGSAPTVLMRMTLLYLFTLNLHDRPHVSLPGVNGVITHAEDDHSPQDQAAVIHGLSRGRRNRWPEAEKQGDGQVDACEGVVDNAEKARYAPRAPDQSVGRGVGERVEGVRRELDATGAAAVEQQSAGDQIGGVQTGDGERDDDGEDGGGANVDEREQAGDNGRDADGPEGHSDARMDLASCQLVERSQEDRRRSSVTYLAQGPPTRHATVASE